MKGGKEKPQVANPDRILSMWQGTTSADGCSSTLFIFQLDDYDINCSMEREAG
jgi:hypothetical protein